MTNNAPPPTPAPMDADVRASVRSISYEGGSSHAPLSRYGRIRVTFVRDTGQVELTHKRYDTQRKWTARLSEPGWTIVLDTLIACGFPRPISDDVPLLPGDSSAVIRWDRDGDVQEVADKGRTGEYADVRRVVFSVVEQIAPGLLGIPKQHLHPSGVEIDSAREIT